MPSLDLISASTEGDKKKFSLNKKIISLGSDPSNDIVIIDSTINDSHAVLQFDGSQFNITALDRKSEIFVNGKKKRKTILIEGDLIKIGNTVFRFSVLEISPTADCPEDFKTELKGFQKLQELSQKLLAHNSLPSVLENLMDSVIELTNADKGFLILTHNDVFSIKVARNIERSNIKDAVEQVSDSIIAKVIASEKSIIVSDAVNDNEFNCSQSVVQLNLSSVMCVPLISNKRLRGLIYVGNDNIVNLFTTPHLELLEIFAAQASLIVANAILLDDLRVDNELLQHKLNEKRFGSIIGSCTVMQTVFRTIEKVAPTNVSVLITGETGTGKELIAHEIHQRSPRSKGPFVTINCGAIPETLLESELFGHVKGAFTGASSTREGKFQAAHNGTIFLDEIGEMPVNLQVKLLRVLQERVITKVGTVKTEAIDIRVLAATNKNLEDAVTQKEFREDLYYRLNVLMIKLPPLRDRGEDILTIAQYLIQHISNELGIEPYPLSIEAKDALLTYSWPGNIRQLENRLKKALVLADASALSAADLELENAQLKPLKPLADAKEKFAFQYIMKALERHGGNRTKAANELGVDPRTIFRYLGKDFA